MDSAERNKLLELAFSERNFIQSVVCNLTGRKIKDPDVEDIVGEVYHSLCKTGIDSYDSSKPLRPWLAMITRNKVIDKSRYYLRHERECLFTDTRYVNNSDGEDPITFLKDNRALNPLQLHYSYDIKKIVYSHINLLDPKHREVISLFYDKELNYEEMALRLNVPLGTVKSRLHSAKKKLKKSLEVCLS